MRTHPALTMLQFLGILTLFAILIGLMLPAVCRVRQAAARSTCSNNLKQLGVAVHNFASANSDRLPTGTAPDTLLPVERRLSLNALLLPYIESDKVYSRLARTEPWDSPKNIAAVENYSNRCFLCPMWAEEGWKPTTEQSECAKDHRATTNYIGIGGLGLDSPELPLGHPRIGMFGYDRAIKIMEVMDGASTTALMFESGRNLEPWLRGGSATLRGLDPNDQPYTGVDRQFGGIHSSDSYSFWRKQPSGSNVLIADGSVRFTMDNSDPAIFAALATVAGGETIPADW